MNTNNQIAAQRELGQLISLETGAAQAYRAARRLCGPHSPIDRIYRAFADRAVNATVQERIELAIWNRDCMRAFAGLPSADATALAVDAECPHHRPRSGHGRIAFRAAMDAYPPLAAFQRWDDNYRAERAAIRAG